MSHPGSDVESAAVFEAGVLEHLRSLFNVAMWMARDRPLAEDLVQEACLRAFRFRHQFQPGTNLRAWLFQILRSVFITRHRRVQQAGIQVELEALDSQAVPPPGGADTIRGSVDALARMDIDAALLQLPEEYRMAVVLSDIEGLTMAEVAVALNCPVGTVKSRLFRARALLRKALAAYGPAGS